MYLEIWPIRIKTINKIKTLILNSSAPNQSTLEPKSGRFFKFCSNEAVLVQP